MNRKNKAAVLALILAFMLILSGCEGSAADNIFGGGGSSSSQGTLGGGDDGAPTIVDYSRGTFEGSYFHVESGYEISLASDDTLYFIQDDLMFYGSYVYNEGNFEFTYEDGSVDTGYFMESDPEHPYKPVLYINGIGKFITSDVYWGDSAPTSNHFVGEFYYEGTGAYVAFYSDGTFGFFDENDIIDPDFYEGYYEHNGGKIVLSSAYHSFNYTFYIVDNDTIQINGLDGYFYRSSGNGNGNEMPPPPAYYSAFEDHNLYYELPNTGSHYFMNGIYYYYSGGHDYLVEDCDVEVVLHSVDDNGDGTQTTHFTSYIYFTTPPPDAAMDSHSYTTLFDYYTGYTFKFGDANVVSYTLPYNGRDIVIELTKSFTYDYNVGDSFLLFTLDYTMVSPIGYDGLVFSFDRAPYTYEDSRARVDESYALAYGTPFYEYDHYYTHENFYFKIIN